MHTDKKEFFFEHFHQRESTCNRFIRDSHLILLLHCIGRAIFLSRSRGDAEGSRACIFFPYSSSRVLRGWFVLIPCRSLPVAVEYTVCTCTFARRWLRGGGLGSVLGLDWIAIVMRDDVGGGGGGMMGQALPGKGMVCCCR